MIPMVLIDLASERLGGRVLAASDEFFAPKENLLKASTPIFLAGKYTTYGKWMDGWETRRRRTPGCDWSLIRLGFPGIVHELVIDTSHFKANQPERCSVEACRLEGPLDARREGRLLKSSATKWIELLPPSAVTGDTQNHFSVTNLQPWSHLRLTIYPDGGVARLRVYGEAAPDKTALAGREAINLAALRFGSFIVSSSDESFGPSFNLLVPSRAKNMGDGWETRRRRGPGHDWVIGRLGIPGVVQRVEVDTTHFKGNFPESCSLEGALVREDGAALEGAAWREVLPRVLLRPNARHAFRRQLRNVGEISHVRFNIFPDGGVSRLRIFGIPHSFPPEL